MAKRRTSPLVETIEDPKGLIPPIRIEHQLLAISDEHALKQMADEMNRSMSFEAMIAPIEAGARAIWSQAGLPAIEARGMHAVDASDTRVPGVTDRMLHPVTRFVKDRPYSPEWFAASVIENIFFTRALIAQLGGGLEAEFLAITAFQFGRLVEEAVKYSAWSDDAVTGRKVSRGGSKGSEARRAAERPRLDERNQTWKLKATQIRKGDPDASDRDVAMRIHRIDPRFSVATIRRAIGGSSSPLRSTR